MPSHLVFFVLDVFSANEKHATETRNYITIKHIILVCLGLYFDSSLGYRSKRQKLEPD